MTRAETDAEQEPTTGHGWCSWHNGMSRTIRLIQVQEEGSGPGGSLFACAPCRKIHDLVPLADLPDE